MKRVYPIVVALALVSVLTLPASATVYDYYMDVYGQKSSPSGTEHYVYNKTYIFAMFENQPNYGYYDKRVMYVADPVLWGDVNYAMTTWNDNRPAGIEQMVEVPEGMEQLKIYHTDCPGYPGVAGCFKVREWIGPWMQPNVNLWARADMHISPNPGGYPWGTNARRAIVFHEIGHVLGLADQNNWDGCNPDWYGIMDASTVINNKTYPCDVYAPTSADYDIWESYHLSGHYWYYGMSIYGNGDVTMRYKDYAWNDAKMYATWKWGNSPTGPWYQFADSTTVLDVGSHNDVINRLIASGVNPGAYGIHGKYIRHCTVPVFNWQNSLGTVQCAPAFYYPY